MQPNVQPCARCPFRRTSAPGYLGDATVDEFLGAAMNDTSLPCHLSVDYDDPDWEDKLDEARRCAGSLIFLSNQCKLPREPELRAAVRSVIRDRETIFANAQEFREHHDR